VTLPADRAQRTAWFTVAGLVTAAGLTWLVIRPGTADLQGVGLKRLLQEERTWRHELWLEGSHLNEQELWQIQETLASRVGISTASMKSLLRRAANAKDATYRADGYLLAGSTTLAAAIAGEIAAWHQDASADRARWLHRRADALWREASEDTAAVLQEALRLLDPPDSDSLLRRDVLMDLASWHWHRALFRPEDPRHELTQGLTAIEALLDPPPSPLSADELTAAHRLRGQLHLRLACLETPRDTQHLAQAATAFEQALTTASRPTRPPVWAALHHDLGRTHLEQGRFASAAEAFRQALEVRDAKVSSAGNVDVRVLERRLTERLQSLAFLALAETRLAAVATDPVARDALGASARRNIAAVHGMTLPGDDGPAWIVAQLALLLTQQASRDPAAEDTRRAALTHYPHDQAGEPGVPPVEAFAPPP
jgi:tetratricopeptide (TPR) repeat protein